MTVLTERALECDLFAAAGATAAGTTQVSARAAYQDLLWQRAVLIDLRDPQERARFGAVHTDLGALDAGALSGATSGRRVIVMCQDGVRTPLMVDQLRRAGMLDVAHLIGGFAAWVAAGLPVAPVPVAA